MDSKEPLLRKFYIAFTGTLYPMYRKKACSGKLYIKYPGFSYPFGPKKSSPRNFYIISRAF